MLDRQTLLIMILGVCIVNGLFSPYLVVAIPITAVLMPELFPKTREWVLFFSSVCVSSSTLLLAGVPAALWERLVERDAAGLTAMWIWFGCVVLLTLPALQTINRAVGGS